MKKHADDENLPDDMLVSLLKSAPPSESLSQERKEAIWATLSVRLAERKAIQVSRTIRFSRRSLVRAASLAAMAIIGIVLYLFTTTTHLPVVVARAEVVRGECYKAAPNADREPLAVGAVVRVGDEIHVDQRSGLKLSLLDGTSLWFCEESNAICLGARSQGTPMLNLLKGELRADVAQSGPNGDFGVATPAGNLRVRGTRFNCQVYPALEQQVRTNTEEDKNMKQPGTTLRSIIPAALILTVLSGSVEVQAAEAQQVINVGERSVVTSKAAPSKTESLNTTSYSEKWLGEPGGRSVPEALIFLPVKASLLNRLCAVNALTGAVREVADFMSGYPEVVAKFGGDIALVKVNSLIFSHFGDGPVSGCGHPFVNDRLLLLNLKTGEKMPLDALSDYDPGYVDLSPDRRKLAFMGSQTVNGEKYKEGGVYVLDLESSKVDQLLPGRIMTCPHWSPDSRWLAITTAEGYLPDPKAYKIALIDTVTKEVVQTGLIGAGVYFMPDGKRILYSGGFVQSGSWHMGVPTSGNLFMAEVSGGTSKQITPYPAGGAINPVISPDGSRIAYRVMENPEDFKKGLTIHVLDLESLKDHKVVQDAVFGGLEWLDNAHLMQTRFSDEKKTVNMLSLDGDSVKVTSFDPTLPSVDPAQKETRDKAVDRLMEAFRVCQQAVKAQDLHDIDGSVAFYGKARDILQRESDTIRSDNALRLTSDDIAPYLNVFTEEAAKTAVERSVLVVSENLKWYVSTLIRQYYEEKHAFPVPFEKLPQFALQPQMGWQINHISTKDTERAKRLFVVPGDDPDKIVTSYELVSCDQAKGELVLRTPVLANGKRLQAVYHRSENDDIDAKVTEIN